MQMPKEKTHTLYRIWYDDEIVYLGRTNQPLQSRLHGHFFKKPMHREIDIFKVTKIEKTEFSTIADMYLYEIYFINVYKPYLNKDDKASDELSVDLPEVQWVRFEPPLMDKWKSQIQERDSANKETLAVLERRKKQLEKEIHDLRVEMCDVRKKYGEQSPEMELFVNKYDALNNEHRTIRDTIRTLTW